jgi:cbb3-type cytochrome oxidase subunit 3
MVKEKIKRILIAGGLTVCFSFFMQFAFCQTLQTITDKKDILIGEQIKLTFKVPMDGLTKWIVLPDSIPHFEIVETAKPDTVNFKDDSKAIQQTITITSFDSGRWTFPALPVEFAGLAGEAPRILNTDSFFVNVSYSPADSTNQLRDIKPIIKVSVFDFFWLYIAGGALLLLLIIFLLYWYFKKKKKDAPATAVSKLSPFDEAMAELKNLSQYNLQDAAEIKGYHIKLAAIFKNYIGRKQGKNLFNKTAGDLLTNMKEVNLPAENISELATALRCTDAVKFAKYLPLPDQSEDALQKIKETISLTEHKKTNHKP